MLPVWLHRWCVPVAVLQGRLHTHRRSLLNKHTEATHMGNAAAHEHTVALRFMEWSEVEYRLW